MSTMAKLKLVDPVLPLFLSDVPLGYHLQFEKAIGTKDGLNLEFGVASGTSLRALRRIIPADQIIYGFDSFKGLPEAWNGHPVGMYGLIGGEQPPRLPNVILIDGWFQNTVPKFAAEHDEPINLMHIDCDIYSSTKLVFDNLAKNIKAGTMIFFDEYFGYPGWRDHEHRAFMEFIYETGKTFEYLARDNSYRVCVRITS
jgi:hypothetical protein